MAPEKLKILKVQPELHRRLKTHASATQRTLQQVVTEAFDRYLFRADHERPRSIRRST